MHGSKQLVLPFRGEAIVPYPYLMIDLQKYENLTNNRNSPQCHQCKDVGHPIHFAQCYTRSNIRKNDLLRHHNLLAGLPAVVGGLGDESCIIEQGDRGQTSDQQYRILVPDFPAHLRTCIKPHWIGAIFYLSYVTPAMMVDPTILSPTRMLRTSSSFASISSCKTPRPEVDLHGISFLRTATILGVSVVALPVCQNFIHNFTHIVALSSGEPVLGSKAMVTKQVKRCEGENGTRNETRIGNVSVHYLGQLKSIWPRLIQDYRIRFHQSATT